MLTTAYPKPVSSKKAKTNGLQRKTPLRASAFPKRQTATKHSSTRKPDKKANISQGRTKIPAAVMKLVRDRSRGYDEIDGLPGANQGHHIKQRSLGGLDLAINILHVSERNHPYKLHEDQETIQKAASILEERIKKTFYRPQLYSEDELAALLGTKTILVLQQANKGFLKATISKDPDHYYDITPEAIMEWLRA